MTRPPLFWEQHTCLPLTVSAQVAPLGRYARPGGAYVSVNVGYAPHSTQAVMRLVEHFRSKIEEHPDLSLAASLADVHEAHLNDRTVVAFDLEDSSPLAGNLDLVQTFYDLGIRTMLPTYNTRNQAGSGCLDAVDEGLSRYGRDLVKQMNEVGMVVDGSHCSARTGLDLCAMSADPVIYSHSCMRGLWSHERNITDEQALECAATGGVIGIVGVGIFLGANTATIKAMVEHIDYAVTLVGIDHVGIGSDYSFDSIDFNREMIDNPELFPEPYRRWGPIEWIAPEAVLEVGEALASRGYDEQSIEAVLSGNFARIAAAVWRA